MRSLTFFSLLLFGIACLSAGPASAAVVASAGPDITPATPTTLPADVRLLHSGNATHPHNGCAALFDLYP